MSSGVPADVRAKSLEIVLECMHKAEVFFGRSYNTPTLSFDLRGRNGGMARNGREVHLNSTLMMANLSEYYKQVIPHEVAHIIDSQNGGNARPQGVTRLRNGRVRRAKREIHGPSWKRIMSQVFGLVPDRCHEMDTTVSQVRVKAHYEYACTSCEKRFFVSIVRHRKQIAHATANPGASFYSCNKCGRVRGKLRYVGLRGQDPQPHDTSTGSAHVGTTNVFGNMGAQGSLQDNMSIAKAIMLKYGYHLTRQQFIVRAVEAGMKSTTASTYYNQLRRKFT